MRLPVLFFILLMSTQYCFSQIISAPKMECVQVLPNGDVRLTWQPAPVNACGSFLDYIIYFSLSPNGPYQPFPAIANPNQATYVHTGANGNITAWYYYMVANYNCPGDSSLHSDTVDNLSFEAPAIHHATVNINNQTTITWAQGAGSNIYGYIIYHVVNAKNIPIDTIVGAANTSYTDPVNDASVSSQTYTVAAIDSCLDAGLINDTPHTTILLTADPISPCDQIININYTQYRGWPDSELTYKIYLSTDNGTPLLIQATTSNAVNLSYSFPFSGGKTACLFIESIRLNKSDSARSNVVCLDVTSLKAITNFYLQNSSVTSPDNVTVTYSLDPTSNVHSLGIFRSITNQDNYFPIYQVLSPVINGVQTFTDTTALTGEFSYTYKLQATDSCGVIDTSTIGNTIFISGESFPDQFNLVHWNAFSVDSFLVRKYYIYRKNGAGFGLIDSVSAQTVEYTDNVQNVPADSGRYFYYVAAHFVSDFFSNKNLGLISLSNVIELDQTPRFVFPNAFRPRGVTTVFKPVIIDPSNIAVYHLSIFNRWGSRLFQTTDYLAGWDGFYNEKFVPQGGYAWLMVTTLKDGRSFTQKGTFIVIY